MIDRKELEWKERAEKAKADAKHYKQLWEQTKNVEEEKSRRLKLAEIEINHLRERLEYLGCHTPVG